MIVYIAAFWFVNVLSNTLRGDSGVLNLSGDLVGVISVHRTSYLVVDTDVSTGLFSGPWCVLVLCGDVISCTGFPSLHCGDC